jgi:hypothetical protein
MLVRQLIPKIHRKYAGNVKYPAENSDAWNKYLGIANDFKDEYAEDPEHDWDSCFEEREVGTVTTGRVYALDADVTNISDSLFITTTDGREIEFTVIKAKKRNEFTGPYGVYRSGRNPTQITFTGTGDMPANLVGGTIHGGFYVIPKDMKSAGDFVPVDNPNWLIVRTVAELARNDRAKEEQYPDLIGEANELYRKMALANDALPDGQPDEVPVDGYGTVDSPEDC